MLGCVTDRRALSITSDSGDERETRTASANEAVSNIARKLLFKKKITKVSKLSVLYSQATLALLISD